jgi:hypothetical protein
MRNPFPLVPGVLLAASFAFAAQWTLGTDVETSRPALTQPSAKSVRNENATGEVLPVFSFRCDPPIVARIDWQRFISSFSTEVGFKVDDGKFTWLKMKVDDSEQVTYSASSEDTQKLVDLFAKGAKLTVEVSPYSESPITAEFDLDAFESTLGVLAANCR